MPSIPDRGPNFAEWTKFHYLTTEWQQLHTGMSPDLAKLLYVGVDGWRDARETILTAFELFSRVLPILHKHGQAELAEQINQFIDTERHAPLSFAQVVALGMADADADEDGH